MRTGLSLLTLNIGNPSPERAGGSSPGSFGGTSTSWS